VQKIQMNIPLVVRLAGTNVEQGRQILRDSGLPIITANSLADAADKVVEAWKKHRAAKGSAPGSPTGSAQGSGGKKS
jgi:hypothetical protein